MCARILERSTHTSVLNELKRIPESTNALGEKQDYTAEYAQRDFILKQENK